MNKSRILSFFGILAIIALLIGATNKLTIDQQRLNATMSGVSLIGSVPIGGMVAVTPNTHANAWQPPADCSTIKDGFMRTSTSAGVACTVPACSDCIIPTGTTLPNMYQKYARGGGTSGSTGGANTQASNVSVANHATLGISNHTALSLNNHTTLALGAHVITQPTFNAASHYHNSFSLSAGGQTLGTTYRNLRAFDGNPMTSSAGTTCGSTANGTYANSAGCYPNNGGAADTVDLSHSHSSSSVSGTIGNQAGSNGDAAFGTSRTTDVSLTNNHSFTQNIDGHSFSQNISNHSFSQNIDNHSVTNNAVNNEPAYVEVVWVMRVK